MTAPAARFALIAISVAATAAAAAAAPAGSGVLRLDARALTALVAGNMPAPVTVALPGVGEVGLSFSAPEKLTLAKGGVEGEIGVTVRELGVSGTVEVRYEVEVQRKPGIVRLRPVRAAAGGPLSILPDLAGFLPPVELPRGMEWLAPTPDAPQARIRLYIQGVTIDDGELAISFSLLSRPVDRRRRADGSRR